jgi:hypothetical protein
VNFFIIQSEEDEEYFAEELDTFIVSRPWWYIRFQPYMNVKKDIYQFL